MPKDDWEAHRMHVVGSIDRLEKKIEGLIDRVQDMQTKVGVASIIASVLSSVTLTLAVQFIVKRVM
jgi:hypothetical protein